MLNIWIWIIRGGLTWNFYGLCLLIQDLIKNDSFAKYGLRREKRAYMAGQLKTAGGSKGVILHRVN